MCCVCWASLLTLWRCGAFYGTLGQIERQHHHFYRYCSYFFILYNSHFFFPRPYHHGHKRHNPGPGHRVVFFVANFIPHCLSRHSGVSVFTGGPLPGSFVQDCTCATKNTSSQFFFASKKPE